jgi:hypothetical protein
MAGEAPGSRDTAGGNDVNLSEGLQRYNGNESPVLGDLEVERV